jgi:ADP-ribose pyrophosphatase YjhB (NUDIX family)
MSRKQKQKQKSGLNKYYDFSKHEASHYDKYEESFGAIVVAKSYDKILLVSSGPDNDKYWGFPKGHRNDGENNVGAAIREVKEETDVTIDMGDFILDDKGNPLTFQMEFPWNYGEEVLLYHISKVIEKQKSSPSERPYWNRPGSLKKKVTLYLVPVEMDRFKLKPQQDEVSEVAWFTWEEAFQKMSEKQSNHIEALISAFDELQKMKKIAKDKQLPKLSPKLKTDIKARLAKDAKMVSQPISKWPKDKQPKNWEQILSDIKGVSHATNSPKQSSKNSKKEDENSENDDKNSEKNSKKDDKNSEKNSKKDDKNSEKNSKKEDKKEDDRDESSDDASEESSEELKKGGDDDTIEKDNKKSLGISATVAFIVGMLLIGLVLLMFYLVNSFTHHSSDEPVEERVRTPVT